MKKQTTKIQEGKGILKTTIPKTIVDIIELEKGDTLSWDIQDNQIIIKKQVTFQDIPRITLPDEQGICYQEHIKKTRMNIIAIDKKQYKTHTLQKQYIQKQCQNWIMTEDIPNEFIQAEIYNPENIDVQYLSWFEEDMPKSIPEVIDEIQKYKYKRGGKID